jgi:hypothetical protein
MKKINLLYSTLVATALTISPFLTTPLSATVTQSTKTSTLSYNIANILHNRGLERNSAQKISDDFLANDEELFSVLLENIENRCSVLSRDEIMDYISNLALRRKSIELDSYSALIKMVHQIKHASPSKETLAELQHIANMNNAYAQVHFI